MPTYQKPASEPPMAEERDKEPTSVFLTKEQVGKDVKAGDVISFTVKDVDTQTGEVECLVAEAEGGENESAPSEDLGESPLEKLDSMPED